MPPTIRFPVEKPGKPFICHRRTHKLIAPRNAGGIPSLMSPIQEEEEGDTSIIDFHAILRPKISKDSGEILIAFAPQVPEEHEHTRPVHFISKCGISQRALEVKVLKKGYNASGDEMITVEVIDPGNHNSYSYPVERSLLSKSSVFERFFHSEHFQPHANTTLTFTKYQPICIETMVQYLYKGKAAVEFCRAKLMRFKIDFRINCLITLFQLAKQLNLLDLAYDVSVIICKYGDYVNPSNCITLVEKFYGINAIRDTLLKPWANCCISKNLRQLYTMPEFVRLCETSWLKYEIDKMTYYPVTPWKDEEEQKPKMKVKAGWENDLLMLWEKGAPPGSQLGPSPPPRKKVQVQVKGGKKKGEGKGKKGKEVDKGKKGNMEKDKNWKEKFSMVVAGPSETEVGESAKNGFKDKLKRFFCRSE